MDCRADFGAADRIVLDSAVYFLFAWVAGNGYFVYGVRGGICVKFYLICPFAGSGGRSGDWILYGVWAVFSGITVAVCCFVVESVYLLSSCFGGRMFYRNSRSVGEKGQAETNFILIPFSLRGIIKKAADDNRSEQTAPTDFFDKCGRL